MTKYNAHIKIQSTEKMTKMGIEAVMSYSFNSFLAIYDDCCLLSLFAYTVWKAYIANNMDQDLIRLLPIR